MSTALVILNYRTIAPQSIAATAYVNILRNTCVVSRLPHLKGGRVHKVMMWVQPSATATLKGTASKTAASTSLCPLHHPSQSIRKEKKRKKRRLRLSASI